MGTPRAARNLLRLACVPPPLHHGVIITQFVPLPATVFRTRWFQTTAAAARERGRVHSKQSGITKGVEKRKIKVQCQGASANVALHYDPDGIDGHKWRIVEKLWREFFSDPTQWWDHRLEKANARYPDFKHRKKQAALWLGSSWNPPWVGPQLAAMAPSTVQVSIFSWNTRLTRSVEAGDNEKTLELFQQMQCEGMVPNRFTFVPVLNACTSLKALEQGRHIHAQLIQSCCESDVYVGTSLINMYAKCGSIEDAQRVFNRMPTRDVAAWSAMILAHVKCGQGRKALDLYQQMQNEGVKADPITFVGVLNACASLQALEEGRCVHGKMIKSGCELNVFVGNSLIDMYTKCGCIEDARRVFDRMPTRDVAAWNAMILGHVKCGQGQRALDLFQQMHEEGVQPSSITFVGMLNACASVASLEEGRSVHEQIIQSGCKLDVFVGSSLIDMYANCGSTVDAQRVFNKMPAHNLVSMNSMLGGYAMHGEGEEALGHFEWMCQQGAEINTVTFVSLLAACSHAGLMDEGLHYFGSMGLVYGISATLQHYACIVDLFGHAGCLHEAEDLIEVMSCEPDISIHKAFLSACRVHGNVEMGKQIAK